MEELQQEQEPAAAPLLLGKRTAPETAAAMATTKQGTRDIGSFFLPKRQQQQNQQQSQQEQREQQEQEQEREQRPHATAATPAAPRKRDAKLQDKAAESKSKAFGGDMGKPGTEFEVGGIAFLVLDQKQGKNRIV